MDNPAIKLVVNVLLAALLLLFAYAVFRLIVRRDYAAQGRLGALSSGLQLLVFLGFFCFPYLFNPPAWAWFWTAGSSSSPGLYLAGLVVICVGFVVAFGTMGWFGMKRAFGISVDGLQQEGPYKISRNPQVLGGYLMVVGVSLQWPSLYSLGWILLYATITHWMVITEEEHLDRVFGEEYQQYCARVPRYVFRAGKPD